MSVFFQVILAMFVYDVVLAMVKILVTFVALLSHNKNKEV